MAQPANRRLVTEAALEARLTTLGYDSGDRNITASVDEDAGLTAGAVYLRRAGSLVELDLSALVFALPASASLIPIVRLGQPLLPPGFRPPHTKFFAAAQRDLPETHGGVRIDPNGYVYLYQVRQLASGSTSTASYRANAAFLTNNAIPTIRPGSPA